MVIIVVMTTFGILNLPVSFLPHAMGFRGWGEIQLKITHSLTHSLTLLDN